MTKDCLHDQSDLCVALQNMSTFESELENLLGEFHIKMKGENKIRVIQMKIKPLQIFISNKRHEFNNGHKHVLVTS